MSNPGDGPVHNGMGYQIEKMSSTPPHPKKINHMVKKIDYEFGSKESIRSDKYVSRKGLIVGARECQFLKFIGLRTYLFLFILLLFLTLVYMY